MLSLQTLKDRSLFVFLFYRLSQIMANIKLLYVIIITRYFVYVNSCAYCCLTLTYNDVRCGFVDRFIFPIGSKNCKILLLHIKNCLTRMEVKPDVINEYECSVHLYIYCYLLSKWLYFCDGFGVHLIDRLFLLITISGFIKYNVYDLKWE